MEPLCAAALPPPPAGMVSAPITFQLDDNSSPFAVIVIDDPLQVAAAVSAIRAEARGVMDATGDQAYVLGVDMEWVPEKRTGKAKDIPMDQHPTDFTTLQVALLQVATGTTVYLFRMCCFRNPVAAASADVPTTDGAAPVDPLTCCCYCPRELAELLASSSSDAVPLIFSGVGVDGDRSRFSRDYNGVTLSPCLDVAAVYNRVAKEMNNAAHRKETVYVDRVLAAGLDSKCRSLADFADRVLGYKLAKDLALTCSNWTKAVLTPAQVQYAAADVVVSRRVMEVALEGFGYLYGGTRSSQLLQFVAQTSTLKPVADKSAGRTRKESAGSGTGANPAGDGGYMGRRLPYYGNIKVLAPLRDPSSDATADDADKKAEGSEADVTPAASARPRATPTDPAEALRSLGHVMFTVSITKADWYLKEGLADVVDEGVLQEDGTYLGRSIRLKFMPNIDRGEADRALRPDAAFFASDKSNACVVCGNEHPTGGVVRFFIVPQAYRRFFPREFVNHNSFDIALVCVTCMKRVNSIYEQERKRLEVEFKFPISWHSSYEMKKVTESEAAELQQRQHQREDGEEDQADDGNDDDNANDNRPSELGTGIVLAEHNRTILNMSKAATALIMAFVANEAVNATSRAKNKRVDIPAERMAALLLSIDEKLPLYEFPDCASDVDAGRSLHKGKPHWMNAYWTRLVALLGSDEATRAPLLLPTTDAPCPNRLTWRDVYNAMRVDRWKVKLRPAESVSADASDKSNGYESGDGAAADAPSSVRHVGTSHFEYVVNEIVRRSIIGPEAQVVTPEEQQHDVEWMRERLRPVHEKGTRAELEAALGKSGKPYAGPDTPRRTLEAMCRFVFRWRCAFIEQVQPQRMPVGWQPRQGLIGLPDATASHAA
jgi:hypothetical protein